MIGHYTSAMSQEELIGQVLAVGFHQPTPSQDSIDLLQKYHVGNVILFQRNIQSAQQVQELTTRLQSIAQEAGHRQPLLIMLDQENGMVRRFGKNTTIFPGNMALGAIGSEQIAFDVALATGRELQALGINMNLAPVMDVNNNPANPVIGVRSFGEDPRQVARLGIAMMRGYRAAGILTCLKHFPGHGDTTVDSHLALPVIPHDMERLEAIELVPFKSAIAAGMGRVGRVGSVGSVGSVDSVMIAHMYLPALMQNEMLPATLSHAVVTELLRKKLGFEGLIISDCMEMQAVSATIGSEQGTVRALRAGIDLVLISHTFTRQQGSIEAIKVALQNGALSEERIQEAAERVLQLKARSLSWDNVPDTKELAVIGNKTHQQLRDHAYELSTTVVKDEDTLLPLRLQAEQRLCLLFLQPSSFTLAIDAGLSSEALVEQIRKRHALIDIISITSVPTLDEYQHINQAVDEAFVTIVVTANANLNPYQGELVQQLLQKRRPIIGVAAYNPYDLLAFPELGTYLVTYEYTQPAFAALVRVLFGEISAQGHLPVSIPGLYEARFLNNA
ncbi:MAG: glycoside hydrolase family 3 protein [Ktedonobacteraceae bacterium]